MNHTSNPKARRLAITGNTTPRAKILRVLAAVSLALTAVDLIAIAVSLLSHNTTVADPATLIVKFITASQIVIVILATWFYKS